jgi:hypothetical protein
MVLEALKSYKKKESHFEDNRWKDRDGGFIVM